MPILKTINLTPDTHKIWEENFAGTEEFSGFVQQCLLDLKAKKNSKGYLLEQIAEEEAKKAESDKKIVHYKNKLKDISNTEVAKEQVKKALPMERGALEKELHKKVMSIRIFCPDLTYEQATVIAKDYLSIPDTEDKPSIHQYLVQKNMVKPKVRIPIEDPIEQIIGEAQTHD